MDDLKILARHLQQHAISKAHNACVALREDSSMNGWEIDVFAMYPSVPDGPTGSFKIEINNESIAFIGNILDFNCPARNTIIPFEDPEALQKTKSTITRLVEYFSL